MIAAAAEVHPKECMGSVCCEAGDKSGQIVAAFPYQIAKRRLEEVTSESSEIFDKFFATGAFLKLGDFHSHPFQGFERIDPLGPSETDLRQLNIGEVEIIVQVRRRRKNGSYWRSNKSGYVSIAWGRYRFLVGAFMRLRGTDEDKVPLYKKIRLSFS